MMKLGGISSEEGAKLPTQKGWRSTHEGPPTKYLSLKMGKKLQAHKTCVWDHVTEILIEKK